MFDIFTSNADGSTQFVISVFRLSQAQEIARQLSNLVPGEYFGFFERIDEVDHVASWDGRRINARNN
jgi:hypothetical protein